MNNLPPDRLIGTEDLGKWMDPKGSICNHTDDMGVGTHETKGPGRGKERTNKRDPKVSKN